VKDVIANSLPKPFILSQLKQTDSTTLLMRPVPVALTQLVPRHEVTEMTDIVLLHPGRPQSTSAPLEDEDGDGDDEDEKENATDDENKFDEKVPEIDSIDLQS
jgi:hypothetical protein